MVVSIKLNSLSRKWLIHPFDKFLHILFKQVFSSFSRFCSFHSIDLDLKKISLENLFIRRSEDILMIDIREYHSSKVKMTFCLEEYLDNQMKICSSSNIFEQLTPASIYNISMTIQRDSFANLFFWPKQFLSKLVSTSTNHRLKSFFYSILFSSMK